MRYKLWEKIYNGKIKGEEMIPQAQRVFEDWTRDRDSKPHNLPEANIKPQLCDVLAEIEEKEISGGALVRVKDVKEILSKYFA